MIRLKKVDIKDSYAGNAYVYLNGEHQLLDTHANIDRGCIKRHARNSNGELELHLTGVISEIVYGDVEIYYTK